MLIFQIIVLYASMAAVDVMDKFLLTKRRIEPVSYTFFTVVSGALLLFIWPGVYEAVPKKFIFFNLLSGAYFVLAMFVFFKVLAFGEVSRVVPFIFGLVPAFDVLLSASLKVEVFVPARAVALAILVCGAMLIAYHPSRGWHRHIWLKVLAAFLFSSYNLLWQYGAQVGGSLNNLMWNRLGAAGVLVMLLIIPRFRRGVFAVRHVPKKQHTSGLFIFKQLLGGLNFVALSHFLAKSSVAVVDALSGFRYVFLFLGALALSREHIHILDEEKDKKVVKLKFTAVAIIFLGIIILFLS